MRRHLHAAFVLLVGAGTSLFADEGRIPIFKPTTITTPGSYVVIRDITVASGNVITIQASDVTLDLNGKSLRINGPTDNLIAVDAGASTLRVTNGRLIGGERAIGMAGVSMPVLLLEARGLELLNQAADAIFVVSMDEISISNCTFRHTGNNGILVIGGATPNSAVRIVDNVFSEVLNRSIVVSGALSVAILNNVSSETAYGIDISHTSVLRGASVIVRGNVLQHRSASSCGVGLGVNTATAVAPTALVLDNVVSGFAGGMSFQGAGFRIAGNIVDSAVTGCGPADGIVLFGSTQSLIEDNQIQGNLGCGISFDSTSTGNAYRNNMLRGNALGSVCDTGSGNTNAGGNIF